MWYLIIGVVILFFLFSSKKSVINQEDKIQDVGLYFMDLEKQVEKSEHSDTIQQFYYLTGCASQGRLDEIKEIYKDANKEDLFYELANEMKPKIMKMAKIAKEVDNTGIGNDMKNGESIGEYQRRKLMKRKAFMDEFNYFKNLDLNEYLKRI